MKYDYKPFFNKIQIILVKIRVPAGVQWIKLNAGGRGLYRANYPESGWIALKKALASGALTSPGDRASLIDDAFTLSR